MTLFHHPGNIASPAGCRAFCCGRVAARRPADGGGTAVTVWLAARRLSLPILYAFFCGARAHNCPKSGRYWSDHRYVKRGFSRGNHDLAADLADRERDFCRVAGLGNFGRNESSRSIHAQGRRGSPATAFSGSPATPAALIPECAPTAPGSCVTPVQNRMDCSSTARLADCLMCKPRGNAGRSVRAHDSPRANLRALLLTWNACGRRVFIESLPRSGIVEFHPIHLA